MTIELWILAASAGLGLIQILLAISAVTRQRGTEWNVGARDAIQAPPTGVAGRLDRASNNFKETFPLFIAGVFLAHAAGRLGGISVTGAILYFASRVVYVPIYAYGIPKLRSVVWLASIIGIILVYASLF